MESEPDKMETKSWGKCQMSVWATSDLIGWLDKWEETYLCLNHTGVLYWKILVTQNESMSEIVVPQTSKAEPAFCSNVKLRCGYIVFGMGVRPLAISDL